MFDNYPQIVTQISDGGVALVTTIDAPWVSVTSINGMTGDVTVQPVVDTFTPNFPYPKDALIAYNGKLYIAKQAFTSGSTFNADDWEVVQSSSASWDDIDGKPSFADVAFSGSYSDLTNKPNLATVATSGSYADLLNKPSLAAVATSGSYSDLRDAPVLATVATSGLYGDLSGIPTNVSTFTNDANYLIGVDMVDTSSIATDIPGARLIDGSVTISKLANGSVTVDKLDQTESYVLSSSTITTTLGGYNVNWVKRTLVGGVTEYSGYLYISSIATDAGSWYGLTGTLPEGLTYNPDTMVFTSSCGFPDAAVIGNIRAPQSGSGVYSFTRQNKYTGTVTTYCVLTMLLKVYS